MRELKNIFKRFCFEGRYMDHDRFVQAFAHVENEGLVHACAETKSSTRLQYEHIRMF